MEELLNNTQALPSGTRLEEFLIERVLGAGGFGITYLARDTALGRQVVIKENLPVQFAWRDPNSFTVAPRHTTGEDAENFAWSLENFSKEAAMLASLDHPGIVRVHRSFRAFGTAYFVMPFVEGEPLDALIRKRVDQGKSFDADEITGLLEHVLDALAYLHDRGIYHRDIKPGNLLITDAGTPVLIDFGSARQKLSERSMTVVESPGYTPFEQLQSRGNVGPWSDLYALGATLAKVITGEALPKANDRAFDDPWVPLADRPEIASRLPAPLLSSIDKAVQPRAQDRWQDGREWIAALNGNGVHVDQQGVGRRPPPMPEDPPQANQRHLRRYAIPAVAILCLLIVAIVWGADQVRSTREAEAERQVQIEAERVAQAESERWARKQEAFEDEAKRIAQAEAERLAKAEAERMAREKAEHEAETKRIAQEETERQAQTSELSNGKIGDERKYAIAEGEEIVLKFVPGGRFQMGSPPREIERGDNEDQVWVTLSNHFWIAETEVTQGQWVAVMGRNPSDFRDGEWKKLPVESVSWNDAQEFIKKLNAESPPGVGWKWALPTEAQWERACRGGTTTATAFGDSLSSRQANFNGDNPYHGAAKGPNLEKTAIVKSYEPNAYGLYDMHGNVWEWCADAYQKVLPGGREPLVSAGSNRVYRGGSWFLFGRNCRSSYRSGRTPDFRSQSYGFRLAVVSSR